MIRTLLTLCLLGVPALGLWPKGFKVSSTSFIAEPQNVTDAYNKGWKKLTRPDGAPGYDSLGLWCPNDDYTLCLLYGENESIAGLQIAFKCDDFNGVFEWGDTGFTYWNVTENGSTTTYCTIRQYYVPPDELIMTTLDETLFLKYGSIYLEDFNGIVRNISIPDLTQDDTIYTKQACYDTMGYHFTYNLTSSTLCRADTLSYWAPLVTDNQLVGTSFLFPGHYNYKNENNLFETPDKSSIQTLVPNGPDCFYNYGDTPGMTTMHIYFIDSPDQIKC